VITLKEPCWRCGCPLGVFEARRVPGLAETRFLCTQCFALGERYVALRARGLSDRQAWRKLNRGKEVRDSGS
jgi:hypothetical protein